MKNSDWILVVEDDSDIAEITKELLGFEGYEAKIAVNGKDALIQISNAIVLPMLIITDYLMPVMNGQELIEYIKHDDRLRTIPVIIISGSFMLAEKAVPGVPILAKPLRVEHLMQKVRELLLDKAIQT